MWAQQQYGDEWHFQRDGGDLPDFCEYVSPDFSAERVRDVEAVLGIRDIDAGGSSSGWLW